MFIKKRWVFLLFALFILFLILLYIKPFKKSNVSFNFNPMHTEDTFSKNAEFVDTKGTFYDAYKKQSKYVSRKWEQYLHIYDKAFAPFISYNKPVTALEIGVENGGFLQIMSDYLPKGSQIIGLDIDERCANLHFDNNIKLFIGDATDKKIIEKYFSNMKFDIIIDDASHINSDVIKTFKELFPKLNYGGVYIVEDTHTSYWDWYPEIGGGFKKEGSMIEYFKSLIDSLHFLYIKDFPSSLSADKINELKNYNQEIASITFYDSVVIVEKYYNKKERRFKNYYTKGEALIESRFRKPPDIECTKDSKFEKYYR